MSRSSTSAVRQRIGTALLAGVLAVSIAGAVAPSASAHDSITGSTPADGSTVTTAPTQVRLTFTDQVKGIGATVVVTDPAGAKVAAGKPSVDGLSVTQKLLPLTVSGRYTVAYRVVSSDGHPITGKLAFTAQLPTPTVAPPPSESATPSASAAPSTSTSPLAGPSQSAIAASPVAATGDAGSSGSGAWLVAGIGLLAALLAVGAVLVRRRRA